MEEKGLTEKRKEGTERWAVKRGRVFGVFSKSSLSSVGFRGPGPQQDKYRRQCVVPLPRYLALSEMSKRTHNGGFGGLMPLNGVVKKLMDDGHDDEPSEFNVHHRLFKKKG